MDQVTQVAPRAEVPDTVIGIVTVQVALDNAYEILKALHQVTLDERCTLDKFSATELMGLWFWPDSDVHKNLRETIVRQPSYWVGQLSGALKVLIAAVEDERKLGG